MVLASTNLKIECALGWGQPHPIRDWEVAERSVVGRWRAGGVEQLRGNVRQACNLLLQTVEQVAVRACLANLALDCQQES